MLALLRLTWKLGFDERAALGKSKNKKDLEEYASWLEDRMAVESELEVVIARIKSRKGG